MERAGFMKKNLLILLAFCLSAAPSSAVYYELIPSDTSYTYSTYNTAKNEADDIFKNSDPQETTILQDNTPNSFVLTKELKNEYKDITKSEKLIEAAELLKNSAGSFSYNSIHGTNPTKSKIKLVFTDMKKNKEHQNSDAYGEFNGNKYVIYINSDFEKSPAGAIAPLLAREGLVSKDKTDEDKETAKKLQTAVWVQLCEKIAGLESANDLLVRKQNMLKSGVNPDDYDVFLKQKAENSNSDRAAKNTLPPKRKFKGKPVQKDFDVNYQAESEKIDSDVMTFDSKELQKKYKKITKEDRIIEALELLKNTVGKFSYEAILKKNLTHKPMVIKFKELSEINPQYASFDALGWRQGGKLNIYINAKHADAPAAAIAALLAHEALHQDEFDSLNEETYAWTMEASVWTQLCDQQPNVSKINHPLVTRENMLKQLFEKGNYSSKYIKKSVFSNPSYSKLPVRSPGFEEDL